MAIDRRTLLLGGAAGALNLAAPLRANAGRPHIAQMFAAARRMPDGRFGAAIFTGDGREVVAAPLPARGHDAAWCATSRRIVVFARRPDCFALVLHPERTRMPFVFHTPADRHFYGHGTFARDGRLLFTTENDFEHGRGVIGIYDATAGFRRLGEFPSHGVGPHDIGFLDDGRTLVVANGGLREHPDFGRGRRVLNPDAIATSLAYIDAGNGDLLESHALPHSAGLSLRHFDIAASGSVVIGAQELTPSGGARCVVFKHDRQHPLSQIDCGDGDPLAGYVSSVAVDSSRTIAAVTSSRTGTALHLDIATGKILGRSRLPDVSGVAAAPAARSFLLTSGSGAIVVASEGGSSAGSGVRTQSQWDNHAIALQELPAPSRS